MKRKNVNYKKIARTILKVQKNNVAIAKNVIIQPGHEIMATNLSTEFRHKATAENNKFTNNITGAYKYGTIDPMLINSIDQITENNSSVISDPDYIPTFENIKMTFSEQIYISPENMQRLFNAVNFVSNDELRPVMNGVAITEAGICGTDAHKLYYHYETFDINDKYSAAGRKGLIIPVDFIKLLQELNITEATLLYTHDKYNNYIKFEDDCYKITSRLIEGTFPNWQNVIPHDYSYTMQVAIKQLLQIMKDVKPYLSKHTNEMQFVINNNILTINVADLDRGVGITKQMPVNTVIDQDNFTFGLNYNFLQTILKTIKTDGVTFKFTDPNKGFLINDNYLLMPIIH